MTGSRDDPPNHASRRHPRQGSHVRAQRRPRRRGVGLLRARGADVDPDDLLLRAARIAPIPVVADPVVLVHWHGGSYFNTRWQMIIDALEYMLAKHPDFADEPRGYARIAGQIAFAYAAKGDRAQARHWAWEALRRDPRQPRAVLALAIAAHLVSPERVLRELNKRGRGI